MKIRLLTEAGIEGFKKYHSELLDVSTTPFPHHLLTEEPYSENFECDISIEKKSFSSRYDLGKYLVERIGKEKLAHEISGQAGLWAWLALFYFEKICEKNDDGSICPLKDMSNYILGSRKNWHRHAIRTTYFFVERYGESVKMMFSKLEKRGEVTEQLSATPYLYSCRGVMETASELYTDPHTGGFVRGAASSKKGGARRFIAFLNQLTLTYDIYSLSTEELMGFLPKEFNRFKAA